MSKIQTDLFLMYVMYLTIYFLEKEVATVFMRMHGFLYINLVLSPSVIPFSASKAIPACALNMYIKQNGT